MPTARRLGDRDDRRGLDRSNHRSRHKTELSTWYQARFDRCLPGPGLDGRRTRRPTPRPRRGRRAPAPERADARQLPERRTQIDPTIYRFYEIVQVYGSTLKVLVHEEFGDGIMSGINFKVTFDKVEDPEGGHRAVITLDGKYPTRPY